MSFHPGQRVICINDDPLSYHGAPSNNDLRGLKKGRIYVVRWCGIFYHEIVGPHAGVLVEGIVRIHQGRDYPFAIGRFRPVVETKTDISIFTKILDDVRHKEPV